MRDPNAPDATYEDLKKVPDHLIGQIVEGVLITMPRPAIGHVRVATELSGELHGPFGRSRGGPGAGPSWSSPSSISAETFWSPTSPVGDVSECPSSRPPTPRS
jgi:hypothetical protein